MLIMFTLKLVIHPPPSQKRDEKTGSICQRSLHVAAVVRDGDILSPVIPHDIRDLVNSQPAIKLLGAPVRGSHCGRIIAIREPLPWLCIDHIDAHRDSSASEI